MNNNKINIDDFFELSNEHNLDRDFLISQNSLIHKKIKDVSINRNKLEKIDDIFSKNLKNENIKISDQKNSGRCWIFATINMIRDKFIKDYKIDNFEFSYNYLSFFDKLEKSNFFLNKMIEFSTKDIEDRELSIILDNPIFDGGFFEMAKNLILKYGLVPLTEMPETFNSSNSNSINNIISTKLKQAMFLIRKEKDYKKQLEIKKEFLSKIYEILTITYGDVPQKFDVKFKSKKNKNKNIHWKNLTPQDFLKKIGFDLTDLFTMVKTPLKKINDFDKYYLKHSNYISENDDLSFLTVDNEYFLLLLVSMIYNNYSVWFSCDVDHFFEENEGVWDETIFEFENFFNLEFDKDLSSDIEFFRVSSNHAMLMQGYHLDSKEWEKVKKKLLTNASKKNINSVSKIASKIPIKKFYVENSWGEKSGNKGYFIITKEWFDKYVYEIVISKKEFFKFINKNKIFSKKELFQIFNPKSNKEKKELISMICEKPFSSSENKKNNYIELWEPFNLKMRG